MRERAHGAAMTASDRPLTFIVRIVAGEQGLRGVVERVRTGRKDEVRRAEDVARVIAAAGEKEMASARKGTHVVETVGPRASGEGSWINREVTCADGAVSYE